MKMDFLYVGLNLNIIIHEKNVRKMHVVWMLLQKQGGLNIQIVRLCCLPPPSKFLAACLYVKIIKHLGPVTWSEVVHECIMLVIS